MRINMDYLCGIALVSFLILAWSLLEMSKRSQPHG
jgi:hypothetical protein